MSLPPGAVVVIPLYLNECVTVPHGNTLFQDKDFIGRGAVERPVDGSTECLVQLQVTPSGDKWLWGHEPVYMEHAHVGWTTSAQYDFRNAKILCWALLNKKVSETSGFEVEVAAERIPAEVRS